MTQQIINGKLIQGHQVASGTSPTSPYPQDTIATQMPFFQKLGLDLTEYFQPTFRS